MLRLGCRDIPAQGLMPPLHPRMTCFRWRDPLEMVVFDLPAKMCYTHRAENLSMTR